MQVNGHFPKSGSLVSTVNYVYNTADCLGKGATASVFLGRERRHGTQVAIKVFENGAHHVARAMVREVEFLKTTKHRNIIKFLACETEIESKRDVLVLEYCQSSVYTLLQTPAYGFGFPEKELRIFLQDITEGLRYLRQRGFIHGDIKPGNLLKRIDDDGRSVFVMTDFGAARELGDEETFQSIQGTEEYIHPEMYKQGVLRLSSDEHFTDACDLWSLAVTIYQVTTGQLPFRAYEGRNDAATMLQIINGRRSGDISGVQSLQNGPIDRSRDFPEFTNCSRAFKELLRPIMADIFEPDKRRTMSSEEYFQAMNEILCLKPLNLFHHETGCNHTLYLHNSNCLVHIQEATARLTEISADRQLITIGSKPLKQIVAVNEQVASYPRSVMEAQLFLYEMENTDTSKPFIPILPTWPSLSFTTSLNADAVAAKKYTATAYYIETELKQTLERQKLFQESVIHIGSYLIAEADALSAVLPDLELILLNEQGRYNSISTSIQMIELLDHMFELHQDHEINKILKLFYEMPRNVNVILNKTSVRSEEIKRYMGLLQEKIREHSRPGQLDSLGCNDPDDCKCIVGNLREQIEAVYSTFNKHKKYRDLHPHELFIHKSERDKLERLGVQILSHYKGHCATHLAGLHSSVQKTSAMLKKHHSRLGKVRSNIDCVRDCLNQMEEKLKKIDEIYTKVTVAIIPVLKSAMVSPAGIKGVVYPLTAASGLGTVLPGGLASVGVVAGGSTGVSSGFISSGLPFAGGTVGGATNVPGETTTYHSIPDATSSKTEQKRILMKQLMEGVSGLRNVSSELDSIMDNNSFSLAELKRILDEATKLSMGSFQDKPHRPLEPVAEYTELIDKLKAVKDAKPASEKNDILDRENGSKDSGIGPSHVSHQAAGHKVIPDVELDQKLEPKTVPDTPTELPDPFSTSEFVFHIKESKTNIKRSETLSRAGSATSVNEDCGSFEGTFNAPCPSTYVKENTVAEGVYDVTRETVVYPPTWIRATPRKFKWSKSPEPRFNADKVANDFDNTRIAPKITNVTNADDSDSGIGMDEGVETDETETDQDNDNYEIQPQWIQKA